MSDSLATTGTAAGDPATGTGASASAGVASRDTAAADDDANASGDDATAPDGSHAAAAGHVCVLLGVVEGSCTSSCGSALAIYASSICMEGLYLSYHARSMLLLA